MPPRGLRFPWWWLLTSRQGYRKSMQGLFGGFLFCYNAGRWENPNKTGVIVRPKTAVFLVIDDGYALFPSPHGLHFAIRGAYSWAGRSVHTQKGNFFRRKKRAGPRIMRAPGMPRTRTRNTDADHRRKCAPVAVPKSDTNGKTPPRAVAV